MKRVIDEKTLKALYPPMETAFEAQMRQTLRSLPVGRRHRGARRKPAAVLVAAAVLALLAATALAIAALSGFFTEATALPLNSSYMENWSLGEKEAVAALLVQYDLPEDGAAWEDALQESGAKRREAALDALFIEHYAAISGGRRNISLHSIMQQELGELDPEWSLEQKAAYSALESEFELGGADEDVNLLPGENDIPREEAVQIAKDAIQAAFGFTDEQMENAALWELSFLVHRSELGVKPPYYSVCLAICDEANVWKAEYAAISGAGEVLTSADGYLGVESPQEAAAALHTVAYYQSDTFDQDRARELARHGQTITAIEPQIVTWENQRIDELLTLQNGTVLVAGREMAENNRDTRRVFAACINEDGETIWRATLDAQENEQCSVTGAMQLEDGRLQLMLNRSREVNHEFEYDLYELATLSEDGKLLDRRQLPSASALSGLDAGSQEVLFCDPGHGGLIVSGSVGTKNTPFYAQVDDRGDVVFHLDMGDMRETVTRLYATRDGYALSGWDKAEQRTRMAFYDTQGQKIREAGADALPAGFHVTSLYPQADGTMWAADDSLTAAEVQKLLRLDENGRVTEEYVINENMGASAFQEAFMRVGGTVALLNRHKTSRDEQTSATHCGLMVLRNGRMEEMYVRGMDWSNLDFSRPKAAAFSPESRKVFIFQLGGQDYIAETGGLTPALSQWAIVELPE
mgnify:FL=1